ncbi:xanthine phosphoribosyltransferase [Actinomyces sp. zg-332]|uniref:xanthine phosphoribosyltransferase n=1 Tax=Actinomyces sp. zg-332 TaxID=2708340 RepID=UPI00141ED840|nr:xanthine phosphoribosyltransferase [Actinomyces sp. zg-332]QPK93785.1 xanthine phosphoribosyltransferase [Actinomyces sp. zg-332]
MELLKEYIRKQGIVEKDNILKVDSFLNHQIDINLLNKIGEEFKKRFTSETITKILTIESSGIAIASITAQYFNVPVVFAKKSTSKTLNTDVYVTKVHSYTHNKDYEVLVSKKYISSNDNVLIIDDFLANGKALLGLIDICRQANANIAGSGIVIEKSFQKGANLIRETGIKLESLAKLSKITTNGIEFVN